MLNKDLLFFRVIIIGLLTALPGFAKAGSADTLPLHPRSFDTCRIDNLKKNTPALTGQGVDLAIICRSYTYIDGQPQNDYRPSTEHKCFDSAKFNFHEDDVAPAGISPHSTAIASILTGDDSNGFAESIGNFDYQGITPKANIEVYEFWHFLINNVFFSVKPDADVVSISCGSQFQSWWTRGIDSMAEKYGLIVVAGIGNGVAASDSLLYPAACANVIGVGVVNPLNTDALETQLSDFALADPNNSSGGLTSDFRAKPDIVAPGNCLAASAEDVNSYLATGSYSSFSTPTVAGTIGLLVQQSKERPELNTAFSTIASNCLAKVIVMNSATKLPYWHKGRTTKDDDHIYPLDITQGAGMLNAEAAYKQLISGRAMPGNVDTTGWDKNTLAAELEAENVYKIKLADAENKMITATLAWNKRFKDSYPFTALTDDDVDFRLQLWAVDSNDPNNPVLVGHSDSAADNVEHIYFAIDANYSQYEIVVSFSDTKDKVFLDDNNWYALAWDVDDKPADDNILWYDLNANGKIENTDLDVLLKNMATYSKPESSYLLGDVNMDSVIDANDFGIIISKIPAP